MKGPDLDTAGLKVHDRLELDRIVTVTLESSAGRAASVVRPARCQSSPTRAGAASVVRPARRESSKAERRRRAASS